LHVALSSVDLNPHLWIRPYTYLSKCNQKARTILRLTRDIAKD
jgi:hypothetical protein